MSTDVAVRERPVIMSGEMVRAILDGAKTQTRRVVKPQPFEGDYVDAPRLTVGEFYPTVIDRSGFEAPGDPVWGVWDEDGEYAARCPYGRPGDRLWVRETWSFIGQQGVFDLVQAQPNNCKPIYKADDAAADRWWPSIHMPRWASRITLKVTDVRVERLQDITEDDAVAEGRPRHNKPPESVSTVEMFALSWNKLNAKRGYPWESNPWVWVLSFARMTARGRGQ